MLDHQADLLARLSNPTLRQVWTDHIANDQLDSWISRNGGNQQSELRSKEATANGAAEIAAMRSALTEAEPFHVSADLTTLVLHAASQLSEMDRVDRTLAPTRCGIARFEGGLPFTDIRGKQMRVSWIAWGPIMAKFRGATRPRHDAGEPEEITEVWMWNDHHLEPDEIAQEMIARFADDWPDVQRLIGRWGFIGSVTLVDATRMGPAYIVPPELSAEKVLTDGAVPHEFTNARRLIHAFWLLLGQTVTSTHTDNPDRARRRRAQRAGLPSRVTVVHLRNVTTRQAPGESLVAWSHRWVVRGFWRWQVCGPDHPQAQEIAAGKWRARIWIAPHVKGPAGKPLITNEKVYAVHR
jgi:hypothetical protein